MITFYNRFPARMVHGTTANKTVLITLNPRGNLHFIRAKRFEIVCCRRLKRGEIKRVKLELEMRFVIFLLIHRIATVRTVL